MTAASSGDNSSLATKCHALASQGKEFKFSITIGATFTFSLDTREDKETLPIRIKKSPSTLKSNWPLAAFSRFVETSHNQNAWSWMRSYRIGSYLTVSQVPQLTWTAVGWGSWQHNRLPFLLLLAVSGNRAMAMKSVCIVFWMNPQWTPQKHSRMDEQSSCQTELSNKFFSRSKLQDNAIRPWLWGLLTRLIIGPNIVSSSWPLECSRLLYALFLHSCVYTHHSNPSRCANLASVQSAAL